MSNDNKIERIPYRPIVAALLVVIITLIGVLWTDINSDLQELKASTSMIEKEYYKIGALEVQIKDLKSQVGRLDQKLDNVISHIEEE